MTAIGDVFTVFHSLSRVTFPETPGPSASLNEFECVTLVSSHWTRHRSTGSVGDRFG